MKKISLLFLVFVCCYACSHKTTPAASTPSNTKTDATAMYESTVKPILEAKCTPCHFPSQGGNKAALDNYAAASNNINEVLSRVQLKPDERGYMPFRGKKEGVTEAEIASLKAWKTALGK